MDPNVENIRAHAMRVIRGRVPSAVRTALRIAVRDGLLGHLPKEGLLPEVYFHPDHKNGAKDRRIREAASAIKGIASVMSPAGPSPARLAMDAMLPPSG